MAAIKILICVMLSIGGGLCCAAGLEGGNFEKTVMPLRERGDILKNFVASAGDFEGELKDSKTDEENIKAKKLIEDFSGPKRPFYQTVMIRIFQAAGVLVLCLIVYIIWFLTGKPVITEDYLAELNRIVRPPAADESQNAAPLYEKAIQSVKENKDYNDLKELVGKKYEEATTNDKEKIGKWITENKEVFDLVIEGSRRSHYWMTYQSKERIFVMMGIIIPNLSEYRYVAYLLRWRAQLLAEQGRFEEAFNDLTACFRFGRHVRMGNKSMVEQLVGMAIEAMSVHTIRSILDKHKIDLNVLADFQRDIEKAVAGESFVINFTSERLGIYDVIQRTFTEGSFSNHIILKRFFKLYNMMRCASCCTSCGERHIGKEIFSDIKKMGYVLFCHPDKGKTLRQADRLYDFYEKIATQSPAQVRVEGIDIEKETQDIIKGNLLIEMLIPAAEKVIEINCRIKIESQATITVIALQRYKQNRGQYPNTLQELVTDGFLKELPIDLWSDKPLVYRKTETGFTLYSIGKNFVDDGGVMGTDDKGKPRSWADNGDEVFWPVVK